MLRQSMRVAPEEPTIGAANSAKQNHPNLALLLRLRLKTARRAES